MKTHTQSQRYVNILHRAVKEGFNPNPEEAIFDQYLDAKSFLLEKLLKGNIVADEDEECEVMHASHHQVVQWNDGMGYAYQCDGEIISHDQYLNAEKGERIYHTTVFDSLGRIIRLYEVAIG